MRSRKRSISAVPNMTERKPSVDTRDGVTDAELARSTQTGDTTSQQIGQLLLEAGKLNAGDLKSIEDAQRSHHQRFGDIAIAMGLATKEDVEDALSQQFDFPYLHPGEGTLDASLYAAYDPMSAASDALRGLRNSLMLRAVTEDKNTLAVLGARESDGASAFAANLAIAFAQLGERTLLVEANFRSPKQDRLFGKISPVAYGLSTVLSGRYPLKQAPQPVPPFSNLSVLCAGPIPPNPQELLGRLNFKYVAETIPAIFDVVIFDAPPVLEFPDAAMIAARTHFSLLVSRRNRSKVADLVAARGQLESCGVTQLGAILVD